MNKDAKIATILLLKGILYKNDNEKVFFELVENSYHVISEYFENIGLEVKIDEGDGYAYLKNKEYEKEEDSLPKLIVSRELNYKTSLLCVILRKKMIDLQIVDENHRAIVSKEDIVTQITLFLDIKLNETKLDKEIDATIKKVIDLGFLKRLKTQDEVYEIKNSIKAFINASWLNAFDEKMQEYQKANAWN